MNRIVRLFIFLIPAIALLLAFKIFWPAKYDVMTLQPRASTRYWQLSTGSRIGYTLLEGKMDAKKLYPLIYLHGGPGAGITNREIETFRMLTDSGYDVYLYDQVGCGSSSRLENISEYTAERHLLDLQEIVNKIGSTKVVLIGQSWGSILALSFIAKYSDMVHKLVITAPAPIQPERKDLRSVSPPDSLQLNLPLLTSTVANEKVRTLRSKAVLYFARKHNVKLASDAEADRFATHYTTELNKSMVCDARNAVIAEGTEGLYVHYITSRSLVKMKDERNKLRTLDTPVLVMKAQCDNQPWGYTAEYLEVFRNCQFAYIRNAGHNIFLEQPDAYVNTIRGFLGR